jgi:hypothetical protein
MTEPTSTLSVKDETRIKRRTVVQSKVSGDKKHPWGVRNRALIRARQLARAGKLNEADAAEDEAAAIAPLTKVERAGIAKAAKKAR